MDCFELCEISSKLQCPYCLEYWTEGIVSCACGTCLFPRRIHKTVDSLISSSKEEARHGARHGKTEAQREYRQAKDCLRKAIKNNNDSILQRFQQSETDNNSRQATGFDEDTCRRLGKIARKDHSCIATWEERQRYVNTRKKWP